MPRKLSPKTEILVHLIETVTKLRALDGCPWDRAQTFQSLRQYLIEEAYETLDILDQLDTPKKLKNNTIRKAFQAELGDLLMQILLHAEIAKEKKAFDIYDIAQELDKKLIRRHPHVFGSQKVHTEDAAFKSWEKQKAKEKDAKNSILDGLPRALPALQKASRVIEKVTKVGFQWKDLLGPLEKVEEELEELKEEILLSKKHGQKNKLAGELGDLFFSLCNLSFLLKINPEDALRATLLKFENRFRFIEKKLKTLKKTPEESTLEEMDHFWREAKQFEENAGIL
ncbi:MAG: nucleoside triphosphate pyrophosphohydrolase [Deltaproteobacteria bacterium]|nr:nucleoside triphosphate pyrophosphohydrolase [Deltaproteobacteria bacterium]